MKGNPEVKNKRSQREDLNLRPADYESAALPTELRWLTSDFLEKDYSIARKKQTMVCMGSIHQ